MPWFLTKGRPAISLKEVCRAKRVRGRLSAKSRKLEGLRPEVEAHLNGPEVGDVHLDDGKPSSAGLGELLEVDGGGGVASSSDDVSGGGVVEEVFGCSETDSVRSVGTLRGNNEGERRSGRSGSERHVRSRRARSGG